jgi:hypothetical protein
MFTVLIEKDYFTEHIKPLAEKVILRRRSVYNKMLTIIIAECRSSGLLTLEIREGEPIEILDMDPMAVAENMVGQLCRACGFEFIIKSTTNSAVIFHKQYKLAEVFKAEATLFKHLLNPQEGLSALPPLLEAIYVAKKTFNIEEFDDWETHFSTLKRLVKTVGETVLREGVSLPKYRILAEGTEESSAKSPGKVSVDPGDNDNNNNDNDNDDEDHDPDAADAIARAAIQADLYSGEAEKGARSNESQASSLIRGVDQELVDFAQKHYEQYIKLDVGVEQVGVYFAEQTISKEKMSLLNFLTSYYSVNITHRRLMLPVPLDYYTQVYYIYAHRLDKSSLVAVLLMNMKVELVPYITTGGGQREADPLVNVWYLLIDIWKTMLYFSNRYIEKDEYLSHIRKQYKRIEEELGSARLDNYKTMAGSHFSANILGKLAALSTLGKKNSFYCYEIVEDP